MRRLICRHLTVDDDVVHPNSHCKSAQSTRRAISFLVKNLCLLHQSRMVGGIMLSTQISTVRWSVRSFVTNLENTIF